MGEVKGGEEERWRASQFRRDAQRDQKGIREIRRIRRINMVPPPCHRAKLAVPLCHRELPHYRASKMSYSLDPSRLHAERDDATASRPRASAQRASCGTPYPGHSACALRSIAPPICGRAVSSYSDRDSGGRAGPRLTAASPRATSTSRCRNFRHTVGPGGNEQSAERRGAGGREGQC